MATRSARMKTIARNGVGVSLAPMNHTDRRRGKRLFFLQRSFDNGGRKENETMESGI